MPTPSDPGFIYAVVIVALILLISFFIIWLFQTKPWIREYKQEPNGNLPETQKFQKELEQLGEKISQITQGLTENTAVLKIRKTGEKSKSIFDDILSKLNSFEKSRVISTKETNSQIEKLNRSLEDSRQPLDSTNTDFQHVQKQINEIREVLPDTKLLEHIIDNLNLLPSILKFIQEVPSSQQNSVSLLQDDREFLATTLANFAKQVDELKSDVKPGNSQNLSNDVLHVLDERLQVNEQRLDKAVGKLNSLLDMQGFDNAKECPSCRAIPLKNARFCHLCGYEWSDTR